MMNKIQHDKLIKYESIFKTAIDSKYYRTMDSRFAADFISMCHELNVYINTSCPACVLKALQTLGKLYFEYKKPDTPAVADSSEGVEITKDNKTIKAKNKSSQKAQKQSKKKK